MEAEESDPDAFVMVMRPVDPLPSIAEIVESFVMLKEIGEVPPNFTEVVPVNFFPFIITVLPEVAVVGEKLMMVGALVLIAAP
jgi:hypothetical protein